MYNTLYVNEGKKEYLHVREEGYVCYAVKTPTIKADDEIDQVVREYAAPHLKSGDTLIISEKMLACTQGRAIPLEAIRVRPLAKFLCQFVYKSPYGIGLAMPETMECALRECGTLRILAAAAISAIGKVFGRRGLFYRIAGQKAAGIDGPCDYTLPPYNRCVVLTPEKPGRVIAKLAERFPGIGIMVVDVNDLNAEIMASHGCEMDKETALALLRQNPLGQSSESTPLGILRRMTLGIDRKRMNAYNKAIIQKRNSIPFL